MAMSDDPLAVYRVVDLAIEKQVNTTNNVKHQSSKDAKNANKRTTKGEASSTQKYRPEQRAISLSKRVAPLLAQLVKE